MLIELGLQIRNPRYCETAVVMFSNRTTITAAARFRQQNHLVRFRKTSLLGVK